MKDILRKKIKELQGRDCGLIGVFYSKSDDLNKDIDLMHCAGTTTNDSDMITSIVKVEDKRPIEVVITNGKKEYGLNDKMDEFTQYSNDEESIKTIDAKDIDDDCSASISYEEIVRKCNKSKLPYKVGKMKIIDQQEIEDDSSADSSADSSIVKKMRQMEPIYIGDIIEYNEPVKVFSRDNLRYGMVESVERENLHIKINTGDVLGPMNQLRRVHCYSLNEKKWSHKMVCSKGVIILIC